jgi:hypothetical protein
MELKNISEQTVGLAGMYLSDSLENPLKWRFQRELCSIRGNIFRSGPTKMEEMNQVSTPAFGFRPGAKPSGCSIRSETATRYRIPLRSRGWRATSPAAGTRMARGPCKCRLPRRLWDRMAGRRRRLMRATRGREDSAHSPAVVLSAVCLNRGITDCLTMGRDLC